MCVKSVTSLAAVFVVVFQNGFKNMAYVVHVFADFCASKLGFYVASLLAFYTYLTFKTRKKSDLSFLNAVGTVSFTCTFLTSMKQLTGSKNCFSCKFTDVMLGCTSIILISLQ